MCSENKKEEMCVKQHGLKYLWDHFEETIAAIIILIMAIINFMNVVGRFALKHSLAWADALTLLLLLWATMLGAAIDFKRGSHFNMGLLSESGGKTRHIILAAAVLLFNVLFSVLVMVTGVKMMLNQISFNGILPTLHIPQAIQGVAVPVGAFFMIVRSVEGFWETLKKERQSEV